MRSISTCAKRIVSVVALCALTSMASADAVFDEVWVAEEGSTDISVVRPDTPDLPCAVFDSQIETPIQTMAVVDGQVWAGCGPNGAVAVYDFDRTFARRFDLAYPWAIQAMCQVGDEVWVASGSTPGVTRFAVDGSSIGELAIDSGGVIESMITVEEEAWGEVDQRVWIVREGQPEIVVVDTTGSLVRTVPWEFPPSYAMTAIKKPFMPVTDDESNRPVSFRAEVWVVQANESGYVQWILDGDTGEFWGMYDSPCTEIQPIAMTHVFEYEQPDLRGDFNGDGIIDLDDFVILKTHFGQSGATHSEGDANGDGAVDLDDFVILKQSFGT